MSELRLVILAIHVLAACIWVGGLLTLGIVVMPAARRLPEVERRTFVNLAARRFAVMGWSALVVLALTGAANLYFRVGDLSALSGPLWATGWGGLLAVKIAMVMTMASMAWIHERYFGPKAVQAGITLTKSKRRALLIVARSTTVAAVIIVGLGVLLSRT